MANWCDVRLIVIGPRAEVKRFHRHARREPLSPPTYVPDIIVDASDVYRPARPLARPKDIFTPDMLFGESKEASASRMKTLGKGLCQKEYLFDVRNDDGRRHFRRISRLYPALYFVLVYHCPNGEEHGSYLIRGGRSRSYLLASGSGAIPHGDEPLELMFAKHGYDYENADQDDYENESRYDEASLELMDQSQMRWLNLVYKRLGVRSPVRQNYE